MPTERILLIAGVAVVMALFAFQLWSVLRTGHVRWRVQKVHRDHRPVAFWIEVAACILGVAMLAVLLIAYLTQ